MHSTPKTIQVVDNGRWVVFRKIDPPLARHWATKHNAETMSLVTPQGDLPQVLIVDLVDVPPVSLDRDTTYDLVEECWVAPSSNLNASNEAFHIQRLLHTQSAIEYNQSRQTLTQAGYPDAVLNTVPRPE